jgi:3-hydroxyacyl-[acyl-carrier-protein] dehydratase
MPSFTDASHLRADGRPDHCRTAHSRLDWTRSASTDTKIESIQPARVPVRFFLIDRITSWQVPTSAEALKNVALSEDFFDDHFPRRPVMPGVLMLEGMAQLSGLLLEASLQQNFQRSAKAILTVLERTKFRLLVRPGDTLVYHTDVTSVNPDGGKVSAHAMRAGEVAVTTGMVFAFKYIDDPLLETRRAALLKTWMQPAQEGR